MKLQRRLTGLAGLAVVVAGIVYILLPVGHIPPYDANLVRLAETDRQGYCSGMTLIQTGGGPDAVRTADCRKESKRPNVANLQVVLPAFCQGVLDGGWEGDVPTCLDIVAQNMYWPTYDGTITNEWNRARPYPAVLLANIGGNGGADGSRTGGRAGSDRGSTPTRGGYTAGY